ncbi:MAG: DUF2306 domain-containing protein [Anaerolineae bacterium]
MNTTINEQMTEPRKQTKRAIPRLEWLIILGLILLSLVPALAGSVRVVELSTSTEITEANARFFNSPLPVLLHIFSVIPYTILGAFQFSRGFRRWKRWHKMVGRVLVVCGLVAALSGLWMSQFYTLPPGDGQFLYWQRVLFGWGMVASILLAVNALRRREYVTHGIWMMRAYAIGVGAGTQVFTHIPWMLFFGTPDPFTRGMLMGAGWVINLFVAEWIIRTRLMPRQRKIALATAQR